jgi:hypothetical protein
MCCVSALSDLFGPALFGPALFGPALFGPDLFGPALFGPATVLYYAPAWVPNRPLSQ